MTNDEMVLRIREDKSIRLEFMEDGRMRTKVISIVGDYNIVESYQMAA